MMWLLGARAALGRAFGMIGRNPLAAVIVALCVALAWFWHLDHRHLAQRDAALEGRVADRAAYITAQAEAQRLAVAARDATERRYKDIAHDADTQAATALADARSLSDRYADTHRLRDQAPHCAGSSAPATAQVDPASHRDGPSPDAVVLSADDFAILNANTVRLEQVRQWGEALVGAGLAD